MPDKNLIFIEKLRGSERKSRFWKREKDKMVKWLMGIVVEVLKRNKT